MLLENRCAGSPGSYNPVERWAERMHVPYAEKYNITVPAWSPIAKGALTGKYRLGKLEFQDVRSRDPVFHPRNCAQVWSVVQLLREIGEKYGRKPVPVALSWLITTSPVIVPTPGAKTPEHVEGLADSVG